MEHEGCRAQSWPNRPGWGAWGAQGTTFKSCPRADACPWLTSALDVSVVVSLDNLGCVHIPGACAVNDVNNFGPSVTRCLRTIGCRAVNVRAADAAAMVLVYGC